MSTQKELEELQQDNQRRLAAIQAQGIAVNVPLAPGPLVELLIETLIGPRDSPEWFAFIHAYEERFRALLDEVESQITRAKLTAPGPAPNGLPQGILRGLP